MEESTRLCSPKWKEETMDCLWHSFPSVTNCFGLISFQSQNQNGPKPECSRLQSAIMNTAKFLSKFYL
ncbi:hypothetical protein Scep_000114 [Stephania cephalantha]|uniref:Uncharacterized protein n=1 Tax=Stephania cephalantha TaxID=152367 RepID=A0AAP0L5I5_9MAGN